MRNQVADLIRQIKAYAELQANPATVYAAAQIPPPAAPTPLPAPGKPTDFAVVLNADGSVTLSWNSSDSAASSGAFFAVSRKLPGQSAFTGIGGAPGSTSESRRPSFTDGTVPASAAEPGRPVHRPGLPRHPHRRRQRRHRRPVRHRRGRRLPERDPQDGGVTRRRREMANSK
jgi:hypothetical protein